MISFFWCKCTKKCVCVLPIKLGGWIFLFFLFGSDKSCPYSKIGHDEFIPTIKFIQWYVIREIYVTLQAKTLL